MQEHGPWQIVQSQEVYRDPWTVVRKDDVIRPDGQPGTHTVVTIKPGVCVLALDDEQHVYLTEEFHYGVGRTTVAVNVAVGAAAERAGEVVLMDAAFQFGDVAILLNLNPRSKSIADLIPELQSGEAESLDTFTVSHSSGLRVLLAPPSPETADLITPAAAKRVVEMFRQTSDLVVVDCPAWFSDTTLAILDTADVILAVLTLEITSIKSIRLFLEIAEQLGYPQDRIVLVLNRADSALGIRVSDVEQSIGRKIDHQIISDGRTVVYALNRGVPFVTSNREMQVSQDVLAIARSLLGGGAAAAAPRAKVERKRGIFSLR
jgi:pilus assembly protein CpaE